MSTSLVLFLHIISFFIQNAASQYGYQQYYQLPVQQQSYYPEEAYKSPTYDTKDNHKHKHHRKRDFDYRRAASTSESEEDINSEENESDECKCNCDQCYAPKSCCKTFCDSCNMPTPGQGLVIVPYPYPYIVSGGNQYEESTTETTTTSKAPTTEKPTETSPTIPPETTTTEKTTEESTTATTTHALRRFRELTTTHKTTTTHESTMTPTTTHEPTTTTEHITTIKDVSTEKLTTTTKSKGHIRIPIEFPPDFEPSNTNIDTDNISYKDILYHKPSDKRHSKYIMMSMRRIKENIVPKYGVVPIPDLLASKLMKQLRNMRILKDPHFYTPDELEDRAHRKIESLK